MKTNKRTSYSNSPVITITTNYNIYLALDANGDIYRVVGGNEELVTVEEFEVELSETTVDMIAEYKERHRNMGTSRGKLAIRIEIQKMLQKGCGYISYNVNHEPLHSIKTSRYYDVLELSNKQERLISAQKTIDNLRNFGTENEKSIKKIISEREKVAAKNKKTSDKQHAAAVVVEAKNLLAKRKEGYCYIAVMRVWSGSKKHLKFQGETKEFRKEKPTTNTYFSLDCKNIFEAKELAKKTLMIK